MSYEAIRERLARGKEQHAALSETELLLIEAMRQLTIALESDLTQIKVALGHVASLLESHRG